MMNQIFQLFKRLVRVLKNHIKEGIFSFTTIISPKVNALVTYKVAYGKWPNLQNPESFKEKLLWLKINQYRYDELVHQCADKLKVRNYVADCGYPMLLNPLISVHKRPDDIDLDAMPKSFVAKWSFGAGMNLVCSNKYRLDWPREKRQLKKWKNVRYHLPYAEMQYKTKEKRLICEHFIGDPESNDSLMDYKIYCFSGVPKCILVMTDRGTGIRARFYTPEWTLLDEFEKYPSIHENINKPDNLTLMLKSAATLSKPFPFVRVDFYYHEGKVIFGEMTFTPAGGLYASEVLIEGKKNGGLTNH